jgi:hypothetical protein
MEAKKPAERQYLLEPFLQSRTYLQGEMPLALRPLTGFVH